MRLNNTLGPKAYKALYREYSGSQICRVHMRSRCYACRICAFRPERHKAGMHANYAHAMVLLHCSALRPPGKRCHYAAGDETFTTALPHDPKLGVLGPFVYAQVPVAQC